MQPTPAAATACATASARGTDRSTGFSQKMCLPAAAAASDQVAVGGGGRADGDGVDALVGEDGFDVGGLGAQGLGEIGSCGWHGVADVFQLHARLGGEVGGVDAANAARTENGYVFHGARRGWGGKKTGQRAGAPLGLYWSSSR